MRGLLLDKAGRPEAPHLLAPSGLPFAIQENLDRGWTPGGPGAVTDHLSRADLGRLPSSVLENLALAEKTRGYGQAQAAGNGLWQQTVYTIVADGTQIAASTAEAILVPDFTVLANSLVPLSTFRYTVYYDASFVVTTPGTLTFRARWGGVAGTVLAASGAYAPSTTALANRSGWVEFLIAVRTIGSAGSMFAMGRLAMYDIDPTSLATVQGNLSMGSFGSAGANTPAVVSSLNTTTANALSVTAQFSVNTAGTQITAHLATLESLF